MAAAGPDDASDERTGFSPVEELAEEGLLLVGASVRLAIKNLLIIRAMRDAADFDEESVRRAVQDELSRIIGERQAAVARLDEEIAQAQLRPGRARRHDDYRADDVPALRRRRATDEALIGRLTALREDREYLHQQLEAAREAALSEVVQAVLTPAESLVIGEDYAADRERRLRLVRRDLNVLALKRRF